MIDLYTWNTPNGRKISIALEEMQLPYRVHPIDIGKDEQFDQEFLKISPNNKIPAIVDGDFTLMESGAILMYLAETSGKLLAPRDSERYWRTIEWLMWQMGGFGPMLGQAHHFRRFAKEHVPYAIERYTNETQRLYGVLDKRLQEATYLAGDDYCIADMATYPWAARHEWHGIALEDFPAVKRWYDAIGARPAVQKGMAVPG